MTSHQAEEAAQRGDWSQFSQILQVLLQGRERMPSVPAISVRDSIYCQSAVSALDGAELESQIDQLLLCVLGVLETGDFRDRWEVSKVFPLFGERAIAPLIERLQNDEIELEVRWFIARMLADLHHPYALDALIQLLMTTPDAELRDIAATALANFGTAAIAPLTQFLSEPHARTLAIKALCQIRQADIVPSLLTVVNDSDASVRAMAIEALTCFDDGCIVPVLRDALQDPVAQVRQAAITGLGLHFHLMPDWDWVSLLQPLLYDLNLEVCRQSAIALGRLGTDAAAVALFETLRSPHTPMELQVELVRALGWMETPIALGYLHHALMHLTFDIVIDQELVSALSRVEQSTSRIRAVQCLLEVLQSNHPALENPRFKQAIALAVGQLNVRSALEPLIQCLSDPNWGTRLHIISALKQLAPEQALQQLQSLVKQPDLSPNLRQGITLALQEW
jgi:HEAT repeat protein